MRQSNFLLLVFVSAFLYCSNLHALYFQKGETFIRKISFAEGLNTKVVYDLYVDDNGLLFLGTDKGLLSYNGVFFKHYSFKDNLGISINTIQQDQNAKLWCKNFSNQLFYFENETLVAYQKANDFLSEQNKNLVDFTFYNNQLYILTEKSLFYENDAGSFIEVYSFKKNNEEFFFSLFNDVKKNRLFLTTNTNILVVKDKEVIGKFTAEKGQKDAALFEDELLYIQKGRNNGLFSLQEEIKNATQKNIYYYNLTQTKKEYWLCTSNGIFEINLKSKRFEDHLLANNRITDIVIDKEGNHWISSLDEGLFFMPNRDMKRLPVKENNALVVNTTSIKANDQGNIFVGTSNGKVIQYDTNQQPVFTYHANTNIDVEYIYPYKNELITSAGLFELGKSSPKIDAYFGKGIAEDAFGNFVIANYNLAGLIPTSFKGKPNVADKLEKKQTVDYISKSTQLYIFRNKRARAVHYSSKKGYYFIGYSDGLYRFGLDGSTYQIKTPNNQPIIATDFHEMENGELWVSSTQQGLLNVKDTEVVKHFHYKNGLSDNKCKKIQADDNGIWVITEESLDYYDIKNEKIENYGNNLGLNGININDFFVDKDFIWFATNEGVIYFPKSILEIKLNPYLEITALQNDGNQLPENASIPFSKNNVVVELNSILYKSLGNYQFEYKLEPFHDNWQSQNAKENKLNFVALEPNKYNLKARIKTGSILSSEINFPFEVDKPFWEKFWFIGTVLLVMTLLLVMVYKWAVLKTKRQQNIKEMLAISQLTALRSQMNPHFIFNVLNAIQGLIYSNQKNKANEYIGTFSTLMRKTLEVSEQREVTIAEEIETIELYVSLEKARFEDDEFFFEIELPNEDLKKYSIPSLIIQPYIENAIKHGLLHKRGVKRMLFKLNKKNKYYWEFTIEDNGVGRKTSQYINQKIEKKHTSFATNATNTRIQLINRLSDFPIQIDIEDMMDNQQKPLGTRVTLCIPIKPTT